MKETPEQTVNGAEPEKPKYRPTPLPTPVTDGDQFICEYVEITPRVGQWRKGRDGRMRKIRDIPFNAQPLYASDLEEDEDRPWGARFERALEAVEEAARVQATAELENLRQRIHENNLREELALAEQGRKKK